MRLASLLITMMALIVPQLSSAQVYQLGLTGRVTSVSSSLSSRFAVGQIASAMVSFDAASPGSQFYLNDPSIWYYPNAPISGSVQTSNYAITFTPASRIFVTDNEGGTIDRFIIEDTDPLGGSVGGLPMNNFFINFQGNTMILASTRLLDVPARLAAFGPASAALDFGTTNDGANRVQFFFDAVSLSAVPEPASWAMMIAGFAFTGATLRRRRTTKAWVRLILRAP